MVILQAFDMRNQRATYGTARMRSIVFGIAKNEIIIKSGYMQHFSFISAECQFEVSSTLCNYFQTFRDNQN